MARLALMVLAFGLIICVYAESDEVQEYRYQDNSRYSRNKGHYDHNRDTGKNHKKWENRPSRHNHNNKGRYSYDKYQNRNNPDYRHSGKGNWASRYDNDHNRGDFHGNKGRNSGWNHDYDSRGRNRDDHKRKNWGNRDKYGSGEDRGNDYHDKNNRFDNNRLWYKDGINSNNDKHNHRGHNEKDFGQRRKFDTPSHGADSYDNYERSSSEEHNYDTTRDNRNKPNTDSESTSNVKPTKNDHYHNRNSHIIRESGNSDEGDRRFEDNGKAIEDILDNYERSSSEEHNYDTIRNSRNKQNTESKSTSNVRPIKNDHYNKINSQRNTGKDNSYESDSRFEDNGKAREVAVSGQIPKFNSHRVGSDDVIFVSRSGEHGYHEDETRENTNNNERKDNNDGSKTDILSNRNDELSKNNNYNSSKVSTTHLVPPGEIKNNKERTDSNDRSIIERVSNRNNGLITKVPDNTQDEKISANNQIYRQQGNTQKQEISSLSQNSGTNDNNDHGDQKSIKNE